MLSNENKSVKNDSYEETIIYVEEKQIGDERKVTFKMDSVGTGICIGVGIPKMDQDLSFIFGNFLMI